MSDERCPRCDRAECEVDKIDHVQREEARVAGLYRGCIDDCPACDAECVCIGNMVDWRDRALAAESRLATSPRTPTPEVLRAAERIGELAKEATMGPWAEVVWYGTDEGGWAAVGPHHTGADDECDDDASDNHARAEADAAFIAECRTLAVVLAEWVKGGGR